MDLLSDDHFRRVSIFSIKCQKKAYTGHANLLISEADLISIDHVDFLLGGCPGTLELVHPWNPEILVGRSYDITQLLDVFLKQP